MIKHITKKKFGYSSILSIFIPAAIFFGVDQSSKFELKNSGLPVPKGIPPWNWDKECTFLSSPSKKPCRYGNHYSGKSILLIGDSHAASASRAIISLGKSHGMDVDIFTFEGCGFVLNNRNFKSNYSYPYLSSSCLAHNQSILAYVRKNRPTIVIYQTRSSSIMILPNNPTSRLHYNSLVAKNLELLINEGIDLIHIGSVPELLPIRTRINYWLGSKSTFSQIPFEDNTFWENQNITPYYLNILSVFCPKKICRNYSKKGWLFHDADHLSEIGSYKLSPYINPLIDDILKK